MAQTIIAWINTIDPSFLQIAGVIVTALLVSRFFHCEFLEWK